MGARIAQLVERAPTCRGLLLDAAGQGPTPTCGPLLHVIPPSLAPFMSSAVLSNKEVPQKIILQKKIDKMLLLKEEIIYFIIII